MSAVCRLAGALGNAGGNHVAVELDEAEHVHEICSPRIVAPESHVAVEPPDPVIVLQNPVPERFERLHKKVLPLAEARGYLTDDDVFRELS